MGGEGKVKLDCGDGRTPDDNASETDLELERRIAYFRAEHFLRVYSYLSREPSIHRVQPSIAIYPCPRDSAPPAAPLHAAATSLLGDHNSCAVCFDSFDSVGS